MSVQVPVRRVPKSTPSVSYCEGESGSEGGCEREDGCEGGCEGEGVHEDYDKGDA